MGSADTGVMQLRGLLNAEGRQLAERCDWQVLTRETSFMTTAAEDQGSLATIVGATNAYRRILNETLWNRSRNEPISGPASSVDWQYLKTLGLSGPFSTYRIRGGQLLLDPTPAAGESVYFEYVTRNWCTSADGSEQRRAVEDDEDVFVLDDEIMLAGVIWRWRQAKGLAYAEDFRAYESMVANAMARDATKRRLSLADSRGGPERRIAVSPGSWPL